MGPTILRKMPNTEVRLKKPIRFKSKVDLLPHLPGMHYVEIPKEVVDSIGAGFKLRVVCTVKSPKGSVTFQGGLMSLGRGRAYLSINKKRMKEAAVIAGSRIEVTLKPDVTEYGLELPEELRELLAQDSEGRKRFEGLTPGRRRWILHYVGQVKSTEKRLERSITLIENLKTLPVGKESFRAMLGMPPREAD